MTTSRLLLIGVVMTLSLALAACSASTDSDSGGSPNILGQKATSEQIAGATGDTSGSPAASQQSSGSIQQIIQTARLELAIRDVRDGAEVLASRAASLGSYVSRSNVTSENGLDVASASYRVPASTLDEFIRSAKGLSGARIDVDDRSAREVSGEYTDLESRLRNAERTEAQLQQFLSQARTTDESLNVYNRLQTIRGEIEGIKGRIALFDNQIAMSTVEVRMTSLVAPAKTSRSPLLLLEDGWEASLAFAGILLSLALISLIVIAWLIPLGILALAGTKLYRRIAPVVARIFAV